MPALTKSEYDMLPATVSLKEFSIWSGLSRDKVRDLAKAGVLGRLPCSGKTEGAKGARHRYFKRDLGRLMGF